MLDLVEGAKMMNGLSPSTGLGASGYGDWINMEGMHTIWAICSQAAPTSAMNFQGYVSDSYAGATPVRAACQYWRSTGVAIDKMVASTQTTGLAGPDAVGCTVAIKFDPASRPNSSQQYFSVAHSSGDACFSIQYIGQPRYGGLGQILATSSST